MPCEGTRYQEQAWLTLLALHERSRDWPQAADTARRLQQAGQGDFTGRLAHYLCEQADHALNKKKDPVAARQLLEQAIADNPGAARPREGAGSRWRQEGSGAEIPRPGQCRADLDRSWQGA